jgi:Flp pilus assembly protein TadG
MHCPKHRRPIACEEEDGAATLEFALVSEAAREGTRYAMVHGNTCSISGTSCTKTPTQIQSYVQGLVLPAITASSLTVTTTYSSYPSGSSCTPNANCENPGNLVTVQVTYPATFNVPFVPPTVLSMTGSSAMVITQ